MTQYLGMKRQANFAGSAKVKSEIGTFWKLVASASLLLVSMSGGAFAQDLTGVWKGDDGASYHIRQVAGEIWWYGKGAGYSNVFHGQLRAGADGSGVKGYVEGRWADVPLGRDAARNFGTLYLVVIDQDRLEANTRGFQTKVWTRAAGAGEAGTGTGADHGTGAAVQGAGAVAIENEIDWDISASSYIFGSTDGLRDRPGIYQLTCKPAPDNYLLIGTVFGSGPNFLDNSSICLAAVFTGRIRPENLRSSKKSDRTVTIQQQNWPVAHDFAKGCGNRPNNKHQNGVGCVDTGSGRFTFRFVP